MCVTDDHQCSNKHCRAVIFHTDPLEDVIAQAIVDGINKDPAMFDMYLPKSPYAHYWHSGPRTDGPSNLQLSNTAQCSTRTATSNDVDLVAGSVNNQAAGPPLNHQAVGLSNDQAGIHAPIGSEGSRESQIAALAQPGGGIFCARPDCRTKNSRSKGHAECTYLLCKSCCQKAAFVAQANGNERLECAERGHRHKGKNMGRSSTLAPTGTSTSQLPASTSAVSMHLPTTAISSILPASQSVSAQQISASLTDTQSTMAMVPPASQTAPPTLHAALSTSTAGPSASGYAQPISMLWQKTSPEWVAKLHAAADAKDRAAERKQMNLELEAQARQTIMAIIWKEVSMNDELWVIDTYDHDRMAASHSDTLCH